MGSSLGKMRSGLMKTAVTNFDVAITTRAKHPGYSPMARSLSVSAFTSNADIH